MQNNKITFRRYQPYLHAYYVPNLHDNMMFYKEFLMGEFNKWDENSVSPKMKVANALIEDIEINESFGRIFQNIIDNYYIVGEKWSGSSIGAYIQNDEKNVSAYHQHISNAVITAVTYIDPPSMEEGGELEVWAMPEKPLKINVEKDIIYFFPAWLAHRPLPQTSKTPRISINWGYDCAQRPIHRLTGDRW